MGRQRQRWDDTSTSQEHPGRGLPAPWQEEGQRPGTDPTPMPSMWGLQSHERIKSCCASQFVTAALANNALRPHWTGLTGLTSLTVCTHKTVSPADPKIHRHWDHVCPSPHTFQAHFWHSRGAG